MMRTYEYICLLKNILNVWLPQKYKSLSQTLYVYLKSDQIRMISFPHIHKERFASKIILYPIPHAMYTNRIMTVAIKSNTSWFYKGRDLHKSTAYYRTLSETTMILMK